jgi:hypothetical protein
MEPTVAHVRLKARPTLIIFDNSTLSSRALAPGMPPLLGASDLWQALPHLRKSSAPYAITDALIEKANKNCWQTWQRRQTWQCRKNQTFFVAPTLRDLNRRGQTHFASRRNSPATDEFGDAIRQAPAASTLGSTSRETTTEVSDDQSIQSLRRDAPPRKASPLAIAVDGEGRRHCTQRQSEPVGTRTRDLRIKSPLLYRLSYRLERLAG